MVCFVHKNQLEQARVEFVYAPSGESLDGRDDYVSMSGGNIPTHLNLHRFVRVCETAVFCSLFDQFASVDNNHCFGRFRGERGDSVDELREDDLYTVSAVLGINR